MGGFKKETLYRYAVSTSVKFPTIIGVVQVALCFKLDFHQLVGLAGKWRSGNNHR